MFRELGYHRSQLKFSYSLLTFSDCDQRFRKSDLPVWIPCTADTLHVVVLPDNFRADWTTIIQGSISSSSCLHWRNCWLFQFFLPLELKHDIGHVDNPTESRQILDRFARQNDLPITMRAYDGCNAAFTQGRLKGPRGSDAFSLGGPLRFKIIRPLFYRRRQNFDRFSPTETFLTICYRRRHSFDRSGAPLEASWAEGPDANTSIASPKSRPCLYPCS